MLTRLRRQITDAPGGWPLALVVWVLCVSAAVLWWQSALSTSAARIAALQPVESYAFAVYQQIVHNLSLHGVFEQSIHQGYDNSWTWSGHRAAVLFPVSWLYRSWPSAQGLAAIQITAIALGVLPAMGLGRRAMAHPLGWLLGAALYLGTGPVMSVALQDYQDLALALPALLVLAWALGARGWWWVPLGVAVGLLPREETAPLVLAMALVVVPGIERGWRGIRWKRWGLNVLLSGLLTAAWIFGVEALFPANGTEYVMPLTDAVGGLGGGSGRVFLDGWSALDSFYKDLLFPGGVFGVLAPGALLVEAGLSLFHMSIPAGNAVDRSWTGHCHHIAPALAFGVVASVQGAGRLLLGLKRIPRLGSALRGLGLALLMVALGLGLQSFGERNAFLFGRQAPAWTHPAWGLASQLPADAVPVVPVRLSLVVADRRVSYSLYGSLGNKAPDLGLAVATHAIIDARERGVLERVRRMPGAQRLAQDTPFELWTWGAGADPSWPVREGAHQVAPEFLGPYRNPEEIPGVPRHIEAPGPNPEHPAPSVRLPWVEQQTGPMGDPNVPPHGGSMPPGPVPPPKRRH